MRKQQPSYNAKEKFTDLGIIEMQPTEAIGSKENYESQNVSIGIHNCYPGVETPTYATRNSACFDIRAYLGVEIEKVMSFNRILIPTKKRVTVIPEIDKRGVIIEPGECLYIPTGFILDIPEGYKVNYYSRSGTSSQKHLKLANSVGIIDSDFVSENMILIYNDSEVRQVIGHGDKIAQGEVVPVLRVSFNVLNSIPEQKTDRTGGFRTYR